jgi:hypothetical protein
MHHHQGTSHALTSLARVFSTCETTLERIPVFAIGLLAAFVAILKSGLALQLPYVWSSDSWPEPTSANEPLSYGFRAIGYLLDLKTESAFHVVSLIAVVCAVLLIAWAISSEVSGNAARWAAVLFLSGPWVWVLIGEVGRVDAITLAGAALLGVKGRSLPWAIAGTALMLLGNPEQAVVATCALLLISFVPALRAWRRGSLAAVLLAFVTWAALWTWARSLGVSGRGDLLIPNLKDSLELFFQNLPLVLYSGFGMLAIVVVWAIADNSGRARALVIFSALVIPITVTMITLDQSRVLVAIATAPLAVLTIRYAPDIYEAARRIVHFPITLLVAATLFLPAIEVVYPGDIRNPWEFYYSLLVSWGDRLLW